MTDTSAQAVTLASLKTTYHHIDTQSCGGEVQAKFDADPALHAVLLFEGDSLVGILSRRSFQHMLTRAFGREVFLHRPLRAMVSMMKEETFILPANLAIHEAAQRALARPDHFKYEPIIVDHQIEAAPSRERWSLLDMTVLLQAQSEMLSRHIEALKAAEQARETLQAELITLSRQAGMAEVATGVLHNVGNVLNSVMVSTARLVSILRESRVDNVRKTAELMMENKASLPEFFASDQRGQMLPGYLAKLADLLAHDMLAMNTELKELLECLEHVRQIVSAQQSFATIKAVNETVQMQELLENALRINALSFERHNIEIVRRFEAVEPLVTDKHHVLQILVNLISNAKKAVRDSNVAQKRITISLSAATVEQGPGVAIEVTDNGLGIAGADLTRIFRHGFTTREDGHGFGLHNSANAARQLGGQLTAASSGPGLGATFTLILPCRNSVAPATRTPTVSALQANHNE